MSLEVSDEVVEFLEVQGGVGKGDAVWGPGLPEDVNEDVSEISVVAAISSDLFGEGIEGLLIPDPEGDVPGGVVCPSLEGVHHFSDLLP